MRERDNERERERQREKETNQRERLLIEREAGNERNAEGGSA